VRRNTVAKTKFGEWQREGNPILIPESLTIHKRFDTGYFAYAAYEIAEWRQVGDVKEIRTRRETFEAFTPEDNIKDVHLAQVLNRLMDIIYTAQSVLIGYVQKDSSGRLRVRPGDEPKEKP
jgi:hypothetical protein